MGYKKEHGVKLGDVREILTFSSKILAYAGSRGLISSRKIERACLENVVFMGLTCGQRLDF